MATDAFNNACDRLANQIDPGGHENRRWAKDEGAKLDEVANLVEQTFAGRDDFELEPTTKTKDARGFILRLKPDHLVARLTAKLSGTAITIWAVDVEGGVATVPPNTNVPGSVSLENITPESVADAVAAALNRISA